MTRNQFKALAERSLWEQAEGAEKLAALTILETPDNSYALEGRGGLSFEQIVRQAVVVVCFGYAQSPIVL